MHKNFHRSSSYKIIEINILLLFSLSYISHIVSVIGHWLLCKNKSLRNTLFNSIIIVASRFFFPLSVKWIWRSGPIDDSFYFLKFFWDSLAIVTSKGRNFFFSDVMTRSRRSAKGPSVVFLMIFQDFNDLSIFGGE